MANASVAQSISRQTVAAALRQARIEAAEHKAWINAINRAALNLESCVWQFDGETLVIASASSNKRYTVTQYGCECRAFADGWPCWHRAARRLLIKAAELAKQLHAVATCRQCGAALEGRQYYVGGKGYVYVDVCSGTCAHSTRQEDEPC